MNLEQGNIGTDLSEKGRALLKQTVVRGLATDRAEVTQSAAGSITARSAAIEQSAVGALSTDRSEAHQSAVGINSSIQLSATEGAIGISYTSLAEVERSNLGLLAAKEVRAGSIKTGILLAGEVEGPVETTLDTRRTLLFGIVAGATIGLVLMIGRQFTRD